MRGHTLDPKTGTERSIESIITHKLTERINRLVSDIQPIEHDDRAELSELATQATQTLNRHQHLIIQITSETLMSALELLIHPKRQRSVITRIIDTWPLSFPDETAMILKDITHRTHITSSALGDTKWPHDASNYMILEWINKAIKRHHAIHTTPSPNDINVLLAQHRTPPKIPPLIWTTSSGTRMTLEPERLAFLYLAEHDIDQGLQRKAMAIDASRTHHDLLLGWKDCPKIPGETASRSLIDQGTRIRLFMPGRSVQLDLPLDGYRTLHDATIHVLRELQGWEGLRHWAALQRLFGVEGERMGWVRWTLDGHMNALGYAKRTRESAARQDAIAKQVELLTRIELEVFTKDGNPASQRPILLVAERSGKIHNSQFKLDGMILQLNPLLYQGVRDDKTKKLGKQWLPGPVELAQVDHARHPYAITLGLLLPIRWRWRLAEGFDHVAIKGKNILTLAGIKKKPDHPERAWMSLERDLKKLNAIGGIGRFEWTGDPWTDESVCRLYPPHWVLDRAVHGLIPEEKAHDATPITGDDLKQWRNKNNLTQIEASIKLGVNLSSIKRSEWKHKERIGPSLRKSFARLEQEKDKKG